MPKPVVPALMLIVLAHAVVAAAQPREEPRFFTYARLGTSAIRADSLRRAPAVGFGVRGEVETFAIDMSFLNLALIDEGNDARDLEVGSLVKIEGLKFLTPDREGSAYIGGGLSWGHVSVSRAARRDRYDASWSGMGLQGELTVGYELPRSSALCFLIQADASLPFFAARSETLAYPTFDSTGSESRRIPSLVLSLGVGWRRW